MCSVIEALYSRGRMRDYTGVIVHVLSSSFLIEEKKNYYKRRKEEEEEESLIINLRGDIMVWLDYKLS
jgi:hypothetical protein